MSEVASYMRGDIGGMLSGAMSFGKKAMGGSKYQEMARQQFTSPADVIEWAGCALCLRCEALALTCDCTGARTIRHRQMPRREDNLKAP